MNRYDPHAARPRTLAQRLRQLNDNLQTLGQRLRESIASTVGNTVAEAVRDGLRRLFGRSDAAPPPTPAPPTFHRHSENRDPLWDDPEDEEADDGWREQEDEEPETFHQPAAPEGRVCSRWRHALGASLRAACWWLERQKPRRPVLTTAVVAIAAGIAAFITGPALVDGLHVVGSMFGLLATSDVASSTAQHLAGFVGG